VFSEGNLIYFTPFYFKNGRPSTNKYFIVLKIDGQSTIIASLPTSINHVPAFLQSKHGCINDDESRVNCYLFEKKRPVCENGFCFDLHTYVHGNEVENYQIDTFKGVYKKEGQDYEIVGKLTQAELKALIDCIINSDSVKNKIKKWLQ
jgi:hypothetical protein